MKRFLAAPLVWALVVAPCSAQLPLLGVGPGARATSVSSTPTLMLASYSGGTQGSTTYVTPPTTGACASGTVVAWISPVFYVDFPTNLTDSVTGAAYTVGSEAENSPDIRSFSYARTVTAPLPVGTTFTITATRIDGDFAVVITCIPLGLSLGGENNLKAIPGTGSTLSISGLAHSPNMIVTGVESTVGQPTPTGAGTWTQIGKATSGSGTSETGMWSFYQEVPSASTASFSFTVGTSGDYAYGYRAVQEGP